MEGQVFLSTVGQIQRGRDPRNAGTAASPPVLRLSGDTYQPEWLPSHPRPLAHGTVDVWLIDLDAEFDESALDGEERARANRFVFQRDAQRYAAGRAELRRLLAAYLGEAPQSLRFEVGDWGKPALAGADRGIAFNLSHCGATALIAIGCVPHLGVDVETIQPIPDRMQVARQTFTAAEMREIQALPATLQESAFFACWTRKEAIIKLWGEGFSADLGSFTVSADPRLPAHVVSVTRPATRTDDITLLGFRSASRSWAALAAWASDDLHINFRTPR